MEINVSQNELGFYLSANYKGCKYGQLYENVTELEAVNNFRALVKSLHNGDYLKVMG